MARDSQTKLSKKDVRSKKQEDLKKKKVENSDSDGNDESDSDNDEMDVHEYRKFLSKIFPSKNINKKINAGEKLKKVINEEIKKKSKKTFLMMKKRFGKQPQKRKKRRKKKKLQKNRINLIKKHINLKNYKHLKMNMMKRKKMKF